LNPSYNGENFFPFIRSVAMINHFPVGAYLISLYPFCPVWPPGPAWWF
jgi:hypothetical protein